MLWKAIFEIAIVVGLLATGGSFWACAKSPGHLTRILRDPNELRRIFDFIGRDKLIEESSRIEPVFGSFANNMVALGAAHLRALSGTRNLMLIASAVLLFLSYLLGIYFLIANAILFVLLAAVDIPVSAKNNNATHVHELIGNIYKWYQLDSTGCFDYCTRQSPMLRELYQLVALNPPTRP